jgi:hypothetical protein
VRVGPRQLCAQHRPKVPFAFCVVGETVWSSHASALVRCPLQTKANQKKGSVLSALSAAAMDPSVGWSSDVASIRTVVIVSDTDYWCVQAQGCCDSSHHICDPL